MGSDLDRHEYETEQYERGYEDGLSWAASHGAAAEPLMMDAHPMWERGFHAGRDAYWRDDPCDCGCHLAGGRGRHRVQYGDYPGAPPEGEWCCDPCNRQAPPTADVLRDLKDRVAVMADALRWQAEQRNTKNAWDAWRCLSDSLYDLHGAFGALALEEQEREESQARRARPRVVKKIRSSKDPAYPSKSPSKATDKEQS